jgi:hypothetical protein
LHYKNRKPKSYKGHCGMCCLQFSDGRRNGRHPTVQERRAATVAEGLDDWEPDENPCRDGFCEGCYQSLDDVG